MFSIFFFFVYLAQNVLGIKSAFVLLYKHYINKKATGLDYIGLNTSMDAMRVTVHLCISLESRGVMLCKRFFAENIRLLITVVAGVLSKYKECFIK